MGSYPIRVQTSAVFISTFYILVHFLHYSNVCFVQVWWVCDPAGWNAEAAGCSRGWEEDSELSPADGHPAETGPHPAFGGLGLWSGAVPSHPGEQVDPWKNQHPQSKSLDFDYSLQSCSRVQFSFGPWQPPFYQPHTSSSRWSLWPPQPSHCGSGLSYHLPHLTRILSQSVITIGCLAEWPSNAREPPFSGGPLASLGTDPTLNPSEGFSLPVDGGGADVCGRLPQFQCEHLPCSRSPLRPIQALHSTHSHPSSLPHYQAHPARICSLLSLSVPCSGSQTVHVEPLTSNSSPAQHDTLIRPLHSLLILPLLLPLLPIFFPQLFICLLQLPFCFHPV